MKKIALTAAAAIALSTVAGYAADLKMPMKAAPAPVVSPWDVAFGGALMSDYIFRGVTQSNHKPSVAAYTELRYNASPSLQWYAGVSGESIDFTNHAAAEIDFYGGVRPTFGALAFDFGYWYYYYPGGQCIGGGAGVGPTCLPTGIGTQIPNGNSAKADASFMEVYAKATWTINDQWALGGNVYYSPNFLQTGAEGTYVSGTFKYTAPASANLWGGAVGWYVSGELGEQFLGTSDAFYGTGAAPFLAGIPYNDYATWNVGVGFTYKVFTLDLRYSDTDMSKSECNIFTSDFTAGSSAGAISARNPGGVQSNWCGSTFIAKLAFDITLGALK